jgi:magnesium transporter
MDMRTPQTPDMLDDDTLPVAAPEPVRNSEELDEEDNTLRPSFLRKVTEALDAQDQETVYNLVEPLHPADIADLFELIGHDYRADLARAINDLLGSEVLAELNDWVRDDLVDELEPDEVAGLAEQMETDDAVALIEDLDEEDQQAVLAEMEPEDRAAIESALSFPEESAGRLMSRDVIAVPEHLSVGDLIDYLRSNDDLAT